MVALPQDLTLANSVSTTRRLPKPLFDRAFQGACLASALLVLIVLAGILGSMIYGGLPAFRTFGFGFLTSSVWDVNNEQFGAWVAVVGTLSSAFIALLIGVPLSLGIAIFLTQLCPAWLKRPVATTIELLAAVPSIIYGMWGLFVFAPLFAEFVQIPFLDLVEGLPVFGTILYARVPSGTGVLTAGIILAFMIIPFIASIARDILDQIPTILRGERLWHRLHDLEVVRHVLVPQAGVSIIGAIMLGLGRALGETMAVTFVIGNANRLSPSIFDPGSTIASRIANEFNEAVGMQLNALMALGCILFLVTFTVSSSRAFWSRTYRGSDGSSYEIDLRHRAGPACVVGTCAPRAAHCGPALKIICALFTLLGAAVLSWILLMLLIEGVSGLSLAVFTQVTPGPGSEGGGIANAIVGSLILTTLGIVVATPVGVFAGTYLAEYGKSSKLAEVIRFINDILLSAPSILIGLFVYTLMVQPMGGYSGWAGGVALAIIAVPVIVRTTEDMLRIVPSSLREAGAALGAPMSKVIIHITWRAARAGMVTGVLLATARIAGETAPLLFTALNNNFWFRPDLMGGVSNLPVTIYQFALAPYQNWRELAWAGSLLITFSILALSIVARLFLKRGSH